MFEFDPYPEFQPSDPSFANIPDGVVVEHLRNVERPTPGAVAAAADVIYQSYEGWDGIHDALGVCMDLSTKIDTPTTVLASMFHDGHAALPRRWTQNPEVERTVLSMCASLELGVLEARRINESQTEKPNDFSVRRQQVGAFVTALQAKK
jgi:hypothetical protein